MIGRIDSTPDRWRARVGRSAALVAIAALIAVGGSTNTLAQQPDTLPDMGQLPSVPPPVPTAPPAGTGGMAFPNSDGPRAPAPLDKKVKPVDAEVDDNPLPPSIQQPGGGATTPADKDSASPGPFFLPPDRMSLGKQRVQVTVDVQASPIMNLNREATVTLVVNNESNVDAAGVSLVYQLPESLKFVSSVPDAKEIPGKPQYQWSMPMLAAGGVWRVVLKVVPISTKPAEHAATVTVKTGSRANSTIQEPKLKVEATSSPGRVLKGEQVNFQIAVQNPGTGPARNVIVQAKLSSGLRSGSDDIVEQTIPVIGPGERIALDVLIVDTIAGGEQSCTVDVRSSDVISVVEDQRVVRTVDVTKPEIVVEIEGQTTRFTGQTNEYKVIVKNTGTAPAKKVRVAASLPQQGGKLVALPPGAKFDLPTRKLYWLIPQLEPKEKLEMTFNYATSTPGLYRATVEATSADLRATNTLTTEVSGLAVLDLQITQTARIIDVGKNDFYDITIKNAGTKEATKLALSGNLTKNLKIVKTFNVDNGVVGQKPETGEFMFPIIERLGVGQSITLSMEVQAITSGPAGCHVFLGHAEMANGEERVEDVISTTITGNGRSKPTAKP